MTSDIRLTIDMAPLIEAAKAAAEALSRISANVHLRMHGAILTRRQRKRLAIRATNGKPSQVSMQGPFILNAEDARRGIRKYRYRRVGRDIH